jgi:hypothetical protein
MCRRQYRVGRQVLGSFFTFEQRTFDHPVCRTRTTWGIQLWVREVIWSWMNMILLNNYKTTTYDDDWPVGSGSCYIRLWCCCCFPALSWSLRIIRMDQSGSLWMHNDWLMGSILYMTPTHAMHAMHGIAVLGHSNKGRRTSSRTRLRLRIYPTAHASGVIPLASGSPTQANY